MRQDHEEKAGAELVTLIDLRKRRGHLTGAEQRRGRRLVRKLSKELNYDKECFHCGDGVLGNLHFCTTVAKEGLGERVYW